MTEILLYGTVGQSFWGEECFTASEVRAQLKGLSGPITVRINSGGGVATDGQAIWQALRDHDGPVNVVIDGIAASAASLIAMAGDTITMPTGAILMIHDPANMWVNGRGTEDDHLAAAAGLRVIAAAYARIYAARAGITPEEAREVMKAETYFDGSAAIEGGFATHTDDAVEASAMAAFDYRLYEHAPATLRAASGSLPLMRTVASALAAMASATSLPAITKGKSMAKKTVTAATAAEDETTEALEEDETTAVEGDDMPEEAMLEEDTDPTVEEEDDGDEEPEAASPAVMSILAYCERNRLPVAKAHDYIKRGLTLAQITAERGGTGKDKPMINSNGPRTRILRDEAETRRTGMEQALVATMTNAREVGGPARQFMGPRKLADMAALYSGRVNRWENPSRVIEMAFGAHSTSDFPAVFENALNKRLASAYEAATPTYRLIAERIDFTDFRPHPISAIGDWPSLQPIGENGEIKAGTVSDKKEVVTLAPYGRTFHISRQMMVNDDLGSMERLLSTRGRAVAAWEDQLFFTMLLSGANADGPTMLETARQLFNTTDGSKAGTAAAISPPSVAKGYAALRSRKGVGADGTFLALTPSIMLTGPAKEYEAAQLLAPIQAAQASNVNPYVGKLQQVTTPHIAGNAWYMFASPAEAPILMYGFLSGESGPRMRMDEPFGSQGVGYSVEEDFGCGATDWRGGYKNAGA